MTTAAQRANHRARLIARARENKATALAIACIRDGITATDARTAPPAFWAIAAESMDFFKPPSADTIALVVQKLEWAAANQPEKETA